ncbi:MAG TPA: lysophospholipid acyltransferase family protein [Anaerolineaceae bacterium]|nr:lysophospholipid acyltransferase family protein [Anaerolineaceae bacterium]
MSWKKLMYLASRPMVLAYADTMLQMDVRKHESLPKGAKIIAANHPSTTDPFFVAGMLRQQSFILINNLLFQVPVLGAYLRRSGHIPVEAGQGRVAVDAALEYLRQGKTIIIFPEGDLSPLEGGFLQSRTGVARLALLSGAPVIPVGIYLQRERCRIVRSDVRGQIAYARWYLRGPYNLTCGKPLRFSGNVEDREHVRWVADTVMHQIIEMAHESETRMTQTPGLSGLPETL